MIESVRAAILQNRLIARGEGVVVGLSGGADSTALTLVLKELSFEMGFRLTAAHFNHGIRGEGAQNDESFVRELCRIHNIPLVCKTADVPGYASANGLSVETAGRLLRYKFLEEVRGNCGADVIATAHHMDDNAESVLLHLIRGSGLKGLCGMDYRRGTLIRPLLGIRRSETEAFLAERGIAYCADETNFIAEGSRNIIRLQILPLLEKTLNPQVVPVIARCAALLREDENYLAETAEKALAESKTDIGYSKEKLNALPRPVLTRAIRLALIEAGAAADIERKHIESIIGLMGARSGAMLSLPHAEARISFGSIVFSPAPARKSQKTEGMMHGEANTARPQSKGECRRKENACGRKKEADAPEASEAFETVLCADSHDMRKVYLPQGSFEVDTVPPPAGIIRSGNIACMDIDKLRFPLKIRYRRPGDRFRPANSGAEKKLKDYFIERKIDSAQRNRIPLVISEGRIVFAAGFGISDEVKITEGTNRILRIVFRKNTNGVL